jgi:putative endonuclease
MASKRNGTLYCGVSSDMPRRGYEHRGGLIEGFTKKYHVHMLVHVEYYNTMEEAIHREKCVKEWKRKWKLELIEKHNPDWVDLYETINA